MVNKCVINSMLQIIIKKTRLYIIEINRYTSQVIRRNIQQAGVTDMRMLSNTHTHTHARTHARTHAHTHTHKKVKWSHAFFFVNSMRCQYVVFHSLSLSLSLFLPKSARHSLGDKTRYSASSPYFGILHCTTLVNNPFTFFKIHGKPPFNIFLLLLLALQKHPLSLVSNVKWTYCSIFTHSCLSKPVRLTLFLSWITEDDILISWWVSFLRTHTMNRGFQTKKKYIYYMIFVIYMFFWTSFMVLLCALWSKAPGTCKISFV